MGEPRYRLSAGQKQRVGIARAILQKGRVLWLEGATSPLDSHAERWIQEALARLFRRCTVVPCPRLSTVLAADQILVLDRGTIVERDAHLELLAADGL